MSVAIVRDVDEVMGRDLVLVESREGGEVQNSDERRAKLVVQSNGGMLTDARCRKFLTGVINDRRSIMYDDNVNAFVRHAQTQLKAAGLIIGRDRAMRLYRLFSVRGTEAIRKAFEVYDQPDQQSD